MKNKTAEQYFDLDDFEDVLWYSFQKIYEYNKLSTFIRYISLSAISRANSEWPLSLVDFRTVLEILIKSYFPEIVEKVRNNNSQNEFSLSKIIYELWNEKYISKEIFELMKIVKDNGNKGTHDPEFVDEELIKDRKDILSFIKILEWFNLRNDT